MLFTGDMDNRCNFLFRVGRCVFPGGYETRNIEGEAVFR